MSSRLLEILGSESILNACLAVLNRLHATAHEDHCVAHRCELLQEERRQCRGLLKYVKREGAQQLDFKIYINI